jgi:hypothetical protein
MTQALIKMAAVVNPCGVLLTTSEDAIMDPTTARALAKLLEQCADLVEARGVSAEVADASHVFTEQEAMVFLEADGIRSVTRS